MLIYDALIDTRLLDFTIENCEKICVGKRSGRHSMKQEEINMLLIEKAKEGAHVVRLKGGDPFVFGRGNEEVDALTEEGIETSNSRHFLLHCSAGTCRNSGDGAEGQPELSCNDRAFCRR